MANPLLDDGGDDLAALGDPGAPEAPPQQQPAPEPADDGPEPHPQIEPPEQPEPPAEPQPPQGYIPASRYREVASERKALKAQLEEVTRNAQAMRAQLEAMRQQPVQPQMPQAAPEAEKPDPEPDRNVDIVGHLEWQNRQLRREMQKTESWRQQQEVVQRQQAERMQLAAAVVPQIEQYRQQAPDYDKALNFARDRLAQQVVTSGYNPMMAPQAIETFETQLAQFAMAWGVNPAALMHATAKAWGYGAEQAEDDDAAPAAERPRDATGRFLPTQAAPAKPAPAPVKSLGNASGAATAGQVTLEAWNRMTDSQRDAAMRKDPTIERRLLGG